MLVSPEPCRPQMVVNTSLLINNSVDAGRRGEVNGLGMMVGSLAKAFGPFVFSVMFAWSIECQRPFPFGAPLAFLILGLGMIVVVAAGWKATLEYETKVAVQKKSNEEVKKGLMSS